MSEPILDVTYRSVESLVPYARNARTHSKAQIAKIARSIRSIGWTQPILVDGDNGIIAGHGRLAAAKSLKMTEVPVIELSGLSPEKKKAYILADNQLAIESGWDFDVLAQEVQALKMASFDLTMTGFDDIDKALAPPAEKPDRAPPQKTAIEYAIVFEREEQRVQWFAFMRKLKQRFPDEDTLGARLARFLNEGGHIGAR
jgi:hypothetical protein